MTNDSLKRWGTVLLLAFSFKAAYSAAATEQLQWLLWPLVELLNATGLFDFAPVAGGEWLDAGRGLIVVKACAGGNFLLASWLGWLWRWRTPSWGPSLALRALVAAWLTTLLANAVRIVLIGYGQDDLARLSGWSGSDSHRLIGIGVYFGALLLQLRRSGSVFAAPVIYLGVTLLVPLLNAWLSGRNGIDMAHALWSVGVPLVALGAARLIFHRSGKKRCLYRLNTRHFRHVFQRMRRDAIFDNLEQRPVGPADSTRKTPDAHGQNQDLDAIPRHHCARAGGGLDGRDHLARPCLP